MWQPTHVKVTVKQAKNLLAKGKNGTNDAFVVIGIGKEKYQTSVKEKASSSLVDWREECELAIPSQGNKAIIQLTVFHNKGLGLEDFLGQISLPLSDFDVYDKPKCRSYKLKGKPEKDKKKGQKERGELDVMVSFTVKSGSLLDINKKEKHKSSITSLKHLGGSLMSIGSKEKQGLKNFAKSVSSKMDKIAKPKKHRKISNNSSSGLPNDLMVSQQYSGYADPGVISDDEDADDFRFDDVKLNTRTSSPMSTMSRGSSLAQEQVLDTDCEVGSYEDPEQDFSCSLGLSPPKPPRIVDQTKESSFLPSFQEPIMNSEKVTSFFEAKPSFRADYPEISETIIEEEASFETKEELEPPSYSLRTSTPQVANKSVQPVIDRSFNIIDPDPLKPDSPLPKPNFDSFKNTKNDNREFNPIAKPRRKFQVDSESKVGFDREPPDQSHSSQSFLDLNEVKEAVILPKEDSCNDQILSSKMETDTTCEILKEDFLPEETVFYTPQDSPNKEQEQLTQEKETKINKRVKISHPSKILFEDPEPNPQFLPSWDSSYQVANESSLSTKSSDVFQSFHADFSPSKQQSEYYKEQVLAQKVPQPDAITSPPGLKTMKDPISTPNDKECEGFKEESLTQKVPLLNAINSPLRLKTMKDPISTPNDKEREGFKEEPLAQKVPQLDAITSPAGLKTMKDPTHRDHESEDLKKEVLTQKVPQLDVITSTQRLKSMKDPTAMKSSQDIVWLDSFIEDDTTEVNIASVEHINNQPSSPNLMKEVEVAPKGQEYLRDGPDSAIVLDNHQESVFSSRPRSTSNASSLLSVSSVSDPPLETQEGRKRDALKPLLKSSSDMSLLPEGSRKIMHVKHTPSTTDSLKLFQEETIPNITRSGSLNEKHPPPGAASPSLALPTSQPQPTMVDEWERKLYGRNGFTGSTENISRSGSRSSLNNTSRESSLHELRKEDSFTRLPEVKALTLERNIVNDFGDDGKKLKKAKSKVSLKSRLFTKGESREKLNEEGRFVEGGNDRLPTLTMRSSKLPQEIHDKFAGKSREDLLEVILNLQSNLDRQMKHSNDLENYIDNLLLRVMEATPHILQTPIETGNTFKLPTTSEDGKLHFGLDKKFCFFYY